MWVGIEGVVCCVYDHTVQSPQWSHMYRRYLQSMYRDNMDLEKAGRANSSSRTAHNGSSPEWHIAAHLWRPHFNGLPQVFSHDGQLPSQHYGSHESFIILTSPLSPSCGIGDVHMISVWYIWFHITPQPHSTALIPYVHNDTYEH